LAFLAAEQGPPGQVDPALGIDFVNHDGDFFAYPDFLFFQIAHVSGAHQPIAAGDQLDKSAEVGDPGDAAGEYIADGQFPSEIVNLGTGPFHHRAIDATDGY
jgi:hypothetical protein